MAAESNPESNVKDSRHMRNVRSDQAPVEKGASNFVGKIKGAVSKKKRRYQGGAYDLDLSYITDRLIAMGFPAENFEKIFRNSMEDTVSFFEEKHPEHYWIYNLCSEREYNESKFHDRVVRFGFDDHNCPIFESMQQLCEHLDEWLSRDTENVAAMHCKAGKGRTGLMICTYLIHSGYYYKSKDQEVQGLVDDVLRYYAFSRTHNQKGVTIPSQKRWISYYARHMERKIDGSLHTHISRSYRINSFFISDDAPSWNTIYVYNDKSMYSKYDAEEFKETGKVMVAPNTKDTTLTSSDGWTKERAQRKDISGNVKSGTLIRCPADVTVYKDVKVQFEVNGTFYGSSRVFSFWFHTDFISEEEPLVLHKDGLDKVNKEKRTNNFFIEVDFEAKDDEEAGEHDNLRKILSSAMSEDTNTELAEKIQMCPAQDLTDDQLVVLGILLQGNIENKNRVWKNTAYLDTFVGAEAAVFFRKMGIESEEEIIQIGTRMMENDFFYPLDMGWEDDDQDETAFRNSFQFYKFNKS